VHNGYRWGNVGFLPAFAMRTQEGGYLPSRRTSPKNEILHDRSLNRKAAYDSARKASGTPVMVCNSSRVKPSIISRTTNPEAVTSITAKSV
jgi:hypothetical protein